MMLSSAGQHADAARCRAVGITSYLTKPIKQSDLLTAMMTVLGATSGDAERSPPATRQTLGTSQRCLRILVAEDSPVNQKLVVRLLEKWGHTVVVAHDGKEAFAALDEQRFDVVLMDVQMPEMDGFEGTAAIRAKEETTGLHVPIIAMTAHAMQGDRERCLEAGMDGYVAKPIRARELFEVVESLAPAGADAGTAAAAVEPAAVAFDKDVALRCVDGDMGLLQELAGAFFQAEYPQLLAEIRSAMTKNEALRLRRAAHTLQGAVGNFGATAAYDAALQLETMGRAEDLTHAAEACAVLEEAMASLHSALIALGKDEAS